MCTYYISVPQLEGSVLHTSCLLWRDSNKHNWASVLQCDSESLGHMPRSGVAGSYGRSDFSFLRFFHTDFQFFILPTENVGPLSLHPHQDSLSFLVFISFILTEIRWNLRIVSVCISLITKSAEHYWTIMQMPGMRITPSNHYFGGHKSPQTIWTASIAHCYSPELEG